MPGASAVVRGSVVAYATELKAQVLGVDADLLAAGGAVQAEVARQMATGVCRVLGADVGVATTGVAGPDPQDGQPVGTVFVAVALGGRRGACGSWRLTGRPARRSGATTVARGAGRSWLAVVRWDGRFSRPGPLILSYRVFCDSCARSVRASG